VQIGRIYTTNYTIENDLTKKRKKIQTNTQTNDKYLSKLVIKQDI